MARERSRILLKISGRGEVTMKISSSLSRPEVKTGRWPDVESNRVTSQVMDKLETAGINLLRPFLVSVSVAAIKAEI